MMGMFYANLYIFKLSAQHSIWSIHICDVRVCLYAEDSVCVCVLWEGGEHLCVCVCGGGGGINIMQLCICSVFQCFGNVRFIVCI